MINLNIRPRGKPIKKLPESVELDFETATAEDIYTVISSVTGLPKTRLRITKGSDGSLIATKRDDGKPIALEETGLRNASQVFVKDLGPQIAWRTVFIVEYLGPLLFHPLFLFTLRPYLYSNSALNPLSYLPFTPSAAEPFSSPTQTQLLLCLLVVLHFVKREYETIFVHRFSAATMPAMNIFKNSSHYWILSGTNLAYWLYAPNASPSASWWPKFLEPESNPAVRYAAVALFVFAQVSNYITHVTLRDLRPTDGSTKRQIPRGYGFNWVTCPNYLFEVLAWVAITVLAGGNWAAMLFLGVAAGQMALWAKKKEIRYRKEFGAAYKKKCAMVPFLW